MVLCITSAVTVQAQPDANRWSLEQCLERALESSPEVHEALADVQIAESKLAQAKAGRLPQAKFTGILSAITGAEGNAVDGDTDKDDLGPYSTGELEVVQPLYTFGRLRNEIRAASQGVATEQAATERARHAVIAAVKELYYNLLFSRQIHELLRESQETFTTAVEKVEERLAAEEPNVTQHDLLRLRVGLAGVTKEIFTIERAIAVTRAALQRQLGLPAESTFDIADTHLEPVELRLQPLATYLDNMAQHRPEIAQIEAGLEARKAQLEAERSTYYPSVFLAGGLEYSVAPNRENQESPFAQDFNSLSGPGVALGVRWQLDFWMTRAKVAEHLAEVAKVEVQKTNAISGIGLEIQRRYLELQEYQKQLEAMQTARRAARALLLTTLTNFNLGVGEAKEIFDGLGLYTRTLGDYYEVLRDFNIGAAKLSQATGEEVTSLQYRR
jgi:outer membrane protein TolC